MAKVGLKLDDQLEEDGLTLDKAYKAVHDKVDGEIRNILQKGKKNGK